MQPSESLFISLVIPLVLGLIQESEHGIFPSVGRSVAQLGLSPQLGGYLVVVLLGGYPVFSPSRCLHCRVAGELYPDPPIG